LGTRGKKGIQDKLPKPKYNISMDYDMHKSFDLLFKENDINVNNRQNVRYSLDGVQQPLDGLKTANSSNSRAANTIDSEIKMKLLRRSQPENNQ